MQRFRQRAFRHMRFTITAGVTLIFLLKYPHAEAQVFQPETDLPAAGNICPQPADIDPFAPDILDFLSFESGHYHQLAMQAIQDSSYLAAARLYLYLLHRQPEDLIAIYNLACCYSRLGRGDLAAAFLLGAVRSGFDRYQEILDDADFAPVSGHPQMIAAMNEIRDRHAAAGAVIYIPAEKLVRSMILPPAGTGITSDMTVIICLHGYGSTPEVYRTIRYMLGSRPVVLVAPEGPYIINSPYLQGRPGFSWEIRTTDREIWRQADPLSVSYITRVVRYMKENHGSKNIFILGFSQGAAYAYYTAVKNPELFKGIIAVAGIFPDVDTEFSFLTAEEIRQAAHLPVLIAHGIHDQALTAEKSRTAKLRLQAYGYPVSYLPFSGGHELTGELLMRIVDWTGRVSGNTGGL